MAAKAGHDLIIDVVGWDATVAVADAPAGWTIELTADPHSLQVREGLRGVKPLTENDRLEIRRNIHEKVLGDDPDSVSLQRRAVRRRRRPGHGRGRAVDGRHDSAADRAVERGG